MRLYNEEYYKPAKKMPDDLRKKNLLSENPWADELQKVFYYLWHQKADGPGMEQ